MKYYLKIRGTVRGPFDLRQVQTLLQQGKIGQYNEISENNVDWRRIKDVLGGGSRTSGNAPAASGASSGGAGSFEHFNNFNDSARSDADDELRVVDSDSSEGSGGANADAVWFVSNDGVSGTGPYTTADVWRLLKTRRATPNSFVWLEGLPARPLKDVPEFGKAADFGAEKEGTASGTATDSTRVGVALQGETRCKRCREPISADSAFCPKCGAANPTARPARTCPRCAASASLSAEKCPKCGCRLVARRKSRLIYVVLGLLGGIVGAHNFYAGRLVKAREQISLALAGSVFLAARPFATRLAETRFADFVGRVEQGCLAVALGCFAILGIWTVFDLFGVKEGGDGLAFSPLFDVDDSDSGDFDA